VRTYIPYGSTYLAFLPHTMAPEPYIGFRRKFFINYFHTVLDSLQVGLRYGQ
jgi:hypothetical protein